jgi:hypothetical protein
MVPNLFLLFNHRFTAGQQNAAQQQLGVAKIISLPPEFQKLWSQIPAELMEIGPYLEPVRSWLASQAKPGDYVLIQGDFGACYLLVKFAMEYGLVPVYSTTKRQAMEEHQEDGSVKMVHHFYHQVFRKYGV